MIADGKEKENMLKDGQENPQDGEPAGAEWASAALEELDDFIESQGVYIRQ